MQMNNPIDFIISGIDISINSFQFNSYAVLPGSILYKCQHSRHLATSCHFNLFGKEHVINMQIGNNFGFVLAQRTNGQTLSGID